MPGLSRSRHPLLRDALIWAVPALVLGAILRILLIHYSPFAYWGSDSDSFFWFTRRLLLEGAISLPAKRHFLYPLFLTPVTLLPGSTLEWLAAIQHSLGLLTTVAVGYIVRASFVLWRWWIVPVTIFYVSLPAIIWYEHELIADGLFALTLVWAMAAWVRWTKNPNEPGRWWVFLICFALCVLTKSAGRFFWPGIFIGLLFTGGWRLLRPSQWIATAALLVVSWTMGEKSQGVRLLYTSSFPLTQLDTDKHAAFKADIADLVKNARRDLDIYYLRDDDAKEFLRRGWRDAAHYPTWAALREDEKQLWSVVRELALEGIKAEPVQFAWIATQRTLAALDPSSFRLDRFEDNYFARRQEDQFREWRSEGRRGMQSFNFLFGRPLEQPLPDEAEFAVLVNPHRESQAAETLNAFAQQFQQTFALFERTGNRMQDFRPTPFAFWVAAAILVSFSRAPYRSSLGTWALVALGYAFAVHLLGSTNPRFVLPCWPILATLLPLPAEALLRLLARPRSS